MTTRPTYIASCSFGKDSIATILLALEHCEPLDRVVFSEVMFDLKRSISGEIPEHIEWIYDTAIPKLRDMGVSVDVVRAEMDYLYWFHRVVRRGPRAGNKYGFPKAGRCVINTHCKVAPIKKYVAGIVESCNVAEPIMQYIGIAADEPRRLAKLTGNKISLLLKYGYTERMARQLCADNDLLSPIYETGTRGGCWFCPCSRLRNFIALRDAHPELWAELVALSRTPNLCSNGFTFGGISIAEIEKRIDAEKLQAKFF